MTEENKKRILLVEDQGLIALNEQATLESGGFEVVLAESGEVAVEQVAGDPLIDLVLMDIDLGKGMDGTEAAKRILALRSIPVVFLTSHSEEAMVRRVRGITRYGYVIKDSGDFVLLSSIEMAFELFDANRKVVEREARYSLLADNISDVLWILNLKTGRWEYISPSVQRLRGYSVEEAMEQSLAQTMTQASHNLFQATVDRLLQEAVVAEGQGGGESCEIEQTRKDGATVWTEVVTKVSRDERGESALIGVSRDISKRKRAERALAETQVLQTAIVDSTQDLIWTVDPSSHRLLTFNRGFGDYFLSWRGLRVEVGMGPEELFSEGDAATWRRCYRLAILDGHYSTELSLQSGETCQLSFNVLRRDGYLFGISAFAKDITERKRSEEILRESEARFRNLLNDVPSIAVQGYGPDGTTQYWNKASERLYGYSAGEAIGRNILDLIIPPEIKEGVGAAIRQMAETGQPIPASELSLMRKDGSRAAVFSSHTIVQVTGREQELFCLDIDLSERNKAEEALRESEEIFERFMEHSPVYVFFKDEEGRSLRLSANYEEMLGRPLPELLGKTMDELFPTELARKMVEDDRRLLREDRQDTVDEELDGRYYTTIKFPIQIGGRPRYLAGYTIDITERKLAEERIKTLLHEKDIILKEVHHRIKNNMNTISSLLALQAGSSKEGAVISALNDAGCRVQSMLLLYDKLYQSAFFDRMSTAEYLPALVDEIVGNFPNSSSVSLRKEIDDIQMDIRRLQPLGIVVNELLTNAMKYAFIGRERGSVLVALSQGEGSILLKVEDDGRGMAEGTDPEHSSGFGLSLIAALAVQLEGTIRIERGKGTCVLMEFPR